MTFNIIDIAILSILALSILIGILRGATREVLGIAGWIGAFATVFYGLPLFRPLARFHIQSPMLADAVVAGVLFILSLAVFILISRVISASVKGSMLGSVDRSLGLVFGVVRGVAIILFAYLILNSFYPGERMPTSIKEARLTPWIAQATTEIKHLIPKVYLPQRDFSQATINPLDAQDLLKNSLPNVEETVKNLSTLKPVSPQKPAPQYNPSEKQTLEKFIEKGE